MFDLTNWKQDHYDFYHPFRALEGWEKEFWNPTFRSDFKVDLQDKGNTYVIEADLPGFKKEDLRVDIQGNYLTIHAKRQMEQEQKSESGNYIRRERSYGTFSRSFDISSVKAEEITAEYTDGVLKLHLPKKEHTQPTSKRLEIK